MHGDAPTPINQNAFWRSMYKNVRPDGETNECTMVHIPIVQKMIALYSPNLHTLGTNHPDYVWAEYSACLMLHNRYNRPIEKLIPIIGACIQCSAIYLSNNPDFMAYARSRLRPA